MDDNKTAHTENSQLKQDNATTLSDQSVAGSTASYTWDTSGVTRGTHTLNLTVTDAAMVTP